MTDWTPSDWIKFLMRDIIVLIFLVIIRNFDVASFFLGLVIGDAILLIASYLVGKIKRMKIKNFIKEWWEIIVGLLSFTIFFLIIYLLMAEIIDVTKGILAFLVLAGWCNIIERKMKD